MFERSTWDWHPESNKIDSLISVICWTGSFVQSRWFSTEGIRWKLLGKEPLLKQWLMSSLILSTDTLLHRMISAFPEPSPVLRSFYLQTVIAPLEGVPTLAWWEGLCAPWTPGAMLAVAWLLAGPPKLDWSRGRRQTKRNTLALQLGGWDVRLATWLS
jgi:hypothetical protein